MSRIDHPPHGHQGNPNIDLNTVASFGDEWTHYDQSELDDTEHKRIFDSYFSIFPWDSLRPNAEGFDMGVGSGRWAELVQPRVGRLNCIDASLDALEVAKRKMERFSNVNFIHSSVDDVSLPLASQDFGYCLGVLHHIPDTQAGIRSCAALLKSGAPFLIYLYYRFDNRPIWFKKLWDLSEFIRLFISRRSPKVKRMFCDFIAALVYYPLARVSLFSEMCGVSARNMPLYAYRDKSFYTMRTDARDRFGTPLEQRFTRDEIIQMMRAAGFERITFSDKEPFWCAVGYRS